MNGLIVGDVATIATKLKPLLLMLSSPQPGEAANAAAAVTRVLRAHNCDWHDLVGVLTKPAATKPPPPDEDEDDAPDWQHARDFCLKHRGRLRGRELDFLTSLRKWRGSPTPKQAEWLWAIYDRVAN